MNSTSNDESDQVDQQLGLTERINGVSKILDTPFFLFLQLSYCLQTPVS